MRILLVCNMIRIQEDDADDWNWQGPEMFQWVTTNTLQEQWECMDDSSSIWRDGTAEKEEDCPGVGNCIAHPYTK